MKKEPLIFIQHILENINNIENFSEGLSENEFIGDKLRQNAIIKSIETIGEAVKNIPDSLKKKYVDVPWKEIVGTRDKMIHHYFGIDLEVVWDIVKKDIPKLKKQIEKVFREEQKKI